MRTRGIDEAVQDVHQRVTYLLATKTTPDNCSHYRLSSGDGTLVRSAVLTSREIGEGLEIDGTHGLDDNDSVLVHTRHFLNKSRSAVPCLEIIPVCQCE
jgi:hypothetical protein